MTEEEMFRDIMFQKEKLIKTWIAETELLPSESTLCTTYFIENGRFIYKYWVEYREKSKEIETNEILEELNEKI